MSECSERVQAAATRLRRLCAPDLRTHSHWYEPAEQLVLNPQGTRALALARRGARYRIACVEPTQRRAESWCDVELGAPGDAALTVTNSWAALATPTQGGMRVVLVNLATGCCALRVELDGSCRVRMRLDAEQRVIADDRGRVRVLSLHDGRILRDAG